MIDGTLWCLLDLQKCRCLSKLRLFDPLPIPLQKYNKQKDNTQSNRTDKTKTKQKNKHQQRKGESDWRSSSVTSDEKEVIALHQLRYWWQNQIKREHDTKFTLPYQRVSEATPHYAETRASSQDPRDHIEQAIKA